ncbi:MAG: hypothetical protein P8078_13065, partial [bacterium]
KMIFLLCLIFSTVQAQDTIQGSYSYTYGDNESLVEARQTCKDLALREAIESYAVFIESSTKVENFQTKDDIVESISAGYLQNVTVVEQQEEGRTITMTVEAVVSPEEVKSIIDKLVMDQQDEPSVQDSTKAISQKTDNKAEPASDITTQYENKLTAIDNLQKQNNYNLALLKITRLKSLLKRHSPRKENNFRWDLYKVNYQYISLLQDFLQFKIYKKERNRIKAAQTLKLIAVKRNSLQIGLNNLEKYENLSEKEETIKQNTLKRGYQLLNSIRKEAQVVRQRRQ